MEPLIIILLGLNFIGILLLIFRPFKQIQSQSGTEQNQKVVETQMSLYRDMLELKAKLEYYNAAMKKESEQLRAERQAFETAAIATSEAKPKEEQNLLLNDRYQDIFALHEQGLTAEEIAKKLDKGCGEVSFILELASHKQA